MTAIPFIKMEGAGNDFVVLDRRDLKRPLSKRSVVRLLDRHFGVGGDQLLILKEGDRRRAHELKIYNPDGSEAEMCGNGVRAIAHYLRRFRGEKDKFTIRTKAGLKTVRMSGGRIDVDMGGPIFEGALVPVKARGPVIGRALRVSDKSFHIHAVSMGNPHCVIFMKGVRRFPVATYGPLIERHPFFPRRVNVEFVEVLTRSHVRARVWERGTGETLACGSGACAIGAVGARFGLLDRVVKVDLPGGRLGVRWAADNHIYLTGPATVVFQGKFLI